MHGSVRICQKKEGKVDLGKQWGNSVQCRVSCCSLGGWSCFWLVSGCPRGTATHPRAARLLPPRLVPPFPLLHSPLSLPGCLCSHPSLTAFGASATGKVLKVTSARHTHHGSFIQCPLMEGLPRPALGPQGQSGEQGTPRHGPEEGQHPLDHECFLNGAQELGPQPSADPQPCGLGVLCRPVSSSGTQGAHGRPSLPSHSDPLAPCLRAPSPAGTRGVSGNVAVPQSLVQKLGADLLKE